MRRKQAGFTIVELLIVVVVIAVLAVISVVAYTGIQNRANDSRMKAGVNQFEKALRLWVLDQPLPIRGGSGSTVVASNGACSDGNSGWIAAGIGYVCSIEDALVSAGNLQSGFIRNLPRNTNYSATDGRYATMFYSCGANRYVLYWTLQNPSAEDIAGMDSALTTCGHGAIFRDSYNMRGGKVLQF